MAGVPVSLNYGPVFTIAEKLGITMDHLFFTKVKIYETEALNCLHDKHKKEHCNEDKKAMCKLKYGDYLEWTCKNCKEINHA
jgi:hypothetical protein